MTSRFATMRACLFLAVAVVTRSFVIDGYMPTAGGLAICPSGGLSWLLSDGHAASEDGHGDHHAAHDHAHAHDHDHGHGHGHETTGEHVDWSQCPWDIKPGHAASGSEAQDQLMVGSDDQALRRVVAGPYQRHRTGLPPSRAPPAFS